MSLLSYKPAGSLSTSGIEVGAPVGSTIPWLMIAGVGVLLWLLFKKGKVR